MKIDTKIIRLARAESAFKKYFSFKKQSKKFYFYNLLIGFVKYMGFRTVFGQNNRNLRYLHAINYYKEKSRRLMKQSLLSFTINTCQRIDTSHITE